VEKPSWRIQGELRSCVRRHAVLSVAGGFEFVLAGISIADPDALDDGGLITAKLTTTRGWCDHRIFLMISDKILRHLMCRWSLPNAWPSILLNGATGIKDALSVTFRATFSNMINIIAQVIALHHVTAM
jgi:hypothetical protein